MAPLWPASRRDVSAAAATSGFLIDSPCRHTLQVHGAQDRLGQACKHRGSQATEKKYGSWRRRKAEGGGQPGGFSAENGTVGAAAGGGGREWEGASGPGAPCTHALRLSKRMNDDETWLLLLLLCQELAQGAGSRLAGSGRSVRAALVVAPDAAGRRRAGRRVGG